MNVSTSLVKKQLAKELDKLPEEKLQEVLDFVGSLLATIQQPTLPTSEKEKEHQGEDDPLLAFIGGVSLGALAKDIDGELYGK
jgi:hypothetical protein